ncbi:MAG: glutamine-hydrolyzing GMP synthase [Candidatus Eisenbacteria bacterium]|nr:glutamine-hydrolyzing GMP synthase [Candidatus Eisenbacteria bacterium]
MARARETILILDFGSQYIQLIARRIREQSVFSEVVGWDIKPAEILARRPKGLVLSGGPRSAFEHDAPLPREGLFDLGIPVLGVCYGMQAMSRVLGGRVSPGAQGEYGRTSFRRVAGPGGRDPLLRGTPSRFNTWMSHRDVVAQLPPGFVLSGATAGSPNAAGFDAGRRLHMLQFHPEVIHSDFGDRVFRNFVRDVCGCRGTWSLEEFVRESTRQIRRRIGDGRAIAALSGGVDSSVTCVLAHRAIGRRLTCIFVDHGLGRLDEAEAATRTLEREFGLRVERVDAAKRFLKKLAGVRDPERKRKIIGEEFIRVFEEAALRHSDARFLVQGTLYPDVIESVSRRGPSSSIKTHHNVGGLPDSMNLKLVEPMRDLFKDEVRRVGKLLGVPRSILTRHPFPGPGLAVRIVGSVTQPRLERLRLADRIFIDELRSAGLYDEIWQAFAVLLPLRSVGVMGDERTYQNIVSLRAVVSRDGMTADWAKIPPAVLARVSGRIVNEVKGINRVVYDVSSKPPATIEWE